MRNIFAGVMKCQHCGGTVTRINKGEHVYLVCGAAHAKAGTCKYETVRYEQRGRCIQDSLQVRWMTPHEAMTPQRLRARLSRSVWRSMRARTWSMRLLTTYQRSEQGAKEKTTGGRAGFEEPRRACGSHGTPGHPY